MSELTVRHLRKLRAYVTDDINYGRQFVDNPDPMSPGKALEHVAFLEEVLAALDETLQRKISDET